MRDITKKSSRAELPERREPYWQRLGEGAYLGFRRGPDTWIARHRGRDRKQQYKSLGDFPDTAKQKAYDIAKKQAEAWFGQMSSTIRRSPKRATVKVALEAYITHLVRQGRDDAAKEALGRFKLTVWGDPIAGLKLERANNDDFLEWRDRLRPGRQPRSIDRHVRSVVAGLNKANSTLGYVGNPNAWKLEKLRDDIDDEGATAVLLTAEQRKALISAASDHASLFLRGLELSGARPKELSAAKVGDYDHDRLKLSHKKGRPPKTRTRLVELGEDGRAFFKAQVRGKLPGALIFTEDGEQPWRRHVWAREVRAAIAAHNAKAKPKLHVPIEASAYSMRHARISELLQVYGVDPLTVAAQTGTSLAMIEKTYFKFIPAAMQEKLKAVK